MQRTALHRSITSCGHVVRRLTEQHAALQGHPGTGKSTLATCLAHSLAWALVDKDDIRDALAEFLAHEATTISCVPVQPISCAGGLTRLGRPQRDAAAESMFAVGAGPCADTEFPLIRCFVEGCWPAACLRKQCNCRLPPRAASAIRHRLRYCCTGMRTVDAAQWKMAGSRNR